MLKTQISHLLLYDIDSITWNQWKSLREGPPPQLTTPLFSDHSQKLQVVEVLMSGFEGSHFFTHKVHFRIYLWFRVGWKRFANYNKARELWQHAIALEVPDTSWGITGHVDLGWGPWTTSDTEHMIDSQPSAIGFSFILPVFIHL